MKTRWFITLALIATVCFGQTATIPWNSSTPKLEIEKAVEKLAPPVVRVAQNDKPAEAPKAKAKAGIRRRELTLRQRRELGLTIANAVAVTKDLQQRGEIDPQASDAELAVQILSGLQSKNPQAYAAADIDLDAILAWIEMILDLIKTLTNLFQGQ